MPSSFTTKSPVCLIANEWRTLNANVQAIEDRAIIVHFAPSPGEVHVKVREWFDDDEVYQFIEEHLLFIPRPSMRYYVKGRQLRQANPERWRTQLLAVMGVDEKACSLPRHSPATLTASLPLRPGVTEGGRRSTAERNASG